MSKLLIFRIKTGSPNLALAGERLCDDKFVIIVMFLILYKTRCEAHPSLLWEKEVGLQPAPLEDLAETTRFNKKNKIPQNFNFLFVDNPKHPQQHSIKSICQAIWRAVVDACSGSRKGKCTFSLEEHLRWGQCSWSRKNVSGEILALDIVRVLQVWFPCLLKSK